MVVATVIGGAGRMGSWFATFLQKAGFQVAIYDTANNAARNVARRKHLRIIQSVEQAVGGSQVIVLATPTEITVRVLRRILKWLSQETLVVDISSVKEPLQGEIKRLLARRIPVLSIHPMFGPGTQSLKGRTVFATSVSRSNSSARRILSSFESKGIRIVRCTTEEHDFLMSALLTLPHFLNMAMTKTLNNRGFDPEMLRRSSGTTFGLQLLIAEAIHQENMDNEASILLDNEYSGRIMTEFARQCTAILRSVRQGRRSWVTTALVSNRKYLQRDSEFGLAYEKFNAAVSRARLASVLLSQHTRYRVSS